MRHLWMMALLAASGIALSAPIPKDKVKDEEAILGTWAVDKFEGDEAELPPPELAKMFQLVFKKDGVLVVKLGALGPEKQTKYKLDPTAKPKSIDQQSGDEKSPGIYDLDGDSLKMCFTFGPNSVRPTEFKATGKSVALMTLKRVKDEPKKK